MADKNKFEEMLERLVNEDKAGAEELFHDIVVEKSRDIYASLIESDIEIEEDDTEVEETTDEEVEEATDEEVEEATDEEVDENFDLDEFEVEGEPEMGGDPVDDMMGDIEADDEDGEEEGEEELEDRVVDLEDALDDLKAEFEKMMGDEEGEGDDEGEEEPEEAFAFEASDEEVEEAADEETDESTKSEAETMREYVEKVTAKMGDNGANSKSPVASANDMGGDASNLVAGGEADTKGTTGGLAAPSEKEDNAGNVNVPGGKAAKSNKAMPKGHGAEKKGAGDTAANKKPVIGG